MRLTALPLALLLPVSAHADPVCAKDVADVWALVASIEATVERQENVALNLADRELYAAFKPLVGDVSAPWRDYAEALTLHCFGPAGRD